MTNRKSTKKALISSVLSLVLCFTMLIGTTFAWFTDSVTSTNNRIVSGKLDVELEYSTDFVTWNKVNESTNVFGEQLWEPGHTEVVYLRVSNEGNLALKYKFGVNIVSEKTSTNVYDETLRLSEHIQYGVVEKDSKFANREDAVAAVAGKSTKLAERYMTDYVRMDAGAADNYLAMVVYMPTTVGNEANYKNADGIEAPEIQLGVNLIATQLDSESDSFDNKYDVNAEYYEVLVTNEEELKKALADGYKVIGVSGRVEAEFVAPGAPDSGHHGTVDFGGATLVGIGDDATFVVKGAGVPDFININLVNLTFEDKGTYNVAANEFMYQNFSGTSTFTNVIFEDDIRLCNPHASSVVPNITIKNCVFNANEDQSYALWIDNGTVNIDNTTFNDIGAYGLIKIENAADLTVTNSLFCDENSKGAIYVSCNGATITAINNTYANCSAGTIVVKDGYNSDINEENANVSTKITVSDENEMATALKDAGAAGAGNTVVTITDDMDMSAIDWTPIKVDGYHGADIVTIDGNYKTIKGLDAPLFSGGFAGGSGIVIKNLTIADSDIVSTNTLGSGAFIESMDSMNVITLENCHLYNSTVTGGAGSRTGGLIGWTAGYSNVNDGPVKTYVTIKDCSVVKCEIKCDGSVGGLYGHAGNNDWTYSVVKNCVVKDNTLASTSTGSWRVGVVVGTANVGELTIGGITESGNTLTQTGKTAPDGQSNLYGRFVPGDTGKLIIDGIEIQ